jgi:hypothetical protein
MTSTIEPNGHLEREQTDLNLAVISHDTLFRMSWARHAALK